MSATVEASARQAQLVRDAFSRGQEALIAGDHVEAIRWLDRAHRLAPRDGTITLVLASAAIGRDNPKAAGLFGEVLAAADVRDAWFGLATARILLGDLAAARDAVAEVLSRHMVWPEITLLADQLARGGNSPGWCGLSSGGTLVIHPIGARPPDVRIDGRSIRAQSAAFILPVTWPRAQSVTVMEPAADCGVPRHFIGSPIALSLIGRTEGRVDTTCKGITGWAWHPGDPDTDPHLWFGSGRIRSEIVATDLASGIGELGPLARPRSFTIAWDQLPAGDQPIRVRGRDGRDLPGSPLARSRADNPGRALEADQTRPDIAAAVPARPRPPAALAQWRDNATHSVILITHDDGGGVERRVQASVALHQAADRRAIVLRPGKSPNGAVQVVASSHSLPELRFELPREQSAVLRLLRAMRPVAAELHHLLNHDPSVLDILRAVGVPYDVHIHDYAWFCPRIALVGRGDRYCGEPAPSVCQTCVAEMGSYLHEDLSVGALLDRSRTILTGASRVIAPSDDAAARLARHFPGIIPSVIPHEDDDAVAEPPPVPCLTGTVRVCVAGAIGLHKGFHVLLACARDARERGLDLTFVVAGTTIDDQSLLDTGHVFVTGPYHPDEAVELIRKQDAALALLPSIWPETWCLGLTELWRAGLRVAAFDIGAPAERIRRTGRGFLLPLRLPAAAINDTLLKAARGRSLRLPIQPPSAYKVSD